MQNDLDQSQNIDSRTIDPNEQKLRNTLMDISSRPGRSLKFSPQGGSKTIKLVAGVFIAILLIGSTALFVSARLNREPTTVDQNQSVTERQFGSDNNSEDYSPSPAGNFQSSSIDFAQSLPPIVKSQNIEAAQGTQATMPDGFAILVASVDKDYKPQSEFDYKKADESGAQYIRVNLIIGNLSDSAMPIGYDDIGLYMDAQTPGNDKIEAKRVTESIYSPVDGQKLGLKQSRKISLHYIVPKNTNNLILAKTKVVIQKADKKSGAEKDPTVTLKIKLD